MALYIKYKHEKSREGTDYCTTELYSPLHISKTEAEHPILIFQPEKICNLSPKSNLYSTIPKLILN